MRSSRMAAPLAAFLTFCESKLKSKLKARLRGRVSFKIRLRVNRLKGTCRERAKP
jgi:hypothetical protein